MKKRYKKMNKLRKKYRLIVKIIVYKVEKEILKIKIYFRMD